MFASDKRIREPGRCQHDTPPPLLPHVATLPLPLPYSSSCSSFKCRVVALVNNQPDLTYYFIRVSLSSPLCDVRTPLKLVVSLSVNPVDERLDSTIYAIVVFTCR